MFSKSIVAAAVLNGVAFAAPAPQAYSSGSLPGYSNADAPFGDYSTTPISNAPSSFGSDSQISAVETSAPAPGQSGAADTLRSDPVTGPTTHGPYSGTPTATGAVSNSPAATTIPALPPNPTATYYNTNGKLQEQQPIPYAPAGGLGTNGSEPRYMVNSDFDYESIMLGLYQEWIELDTFNNGLAIFSEEDFLAAGLSAEDRSLIQFMAQQEEGHATLLSNMLGETAAPQCTYNFPYSNVREFVDFNQILTRFGESGESESFSICVKQHANCILKRCMGLYQSSRLSRSWPVACAVDCYGSETRDDLSTDVRPAPDARLVRDRHSTVVGLDLPGTVHQFLPS